MIITVPFEEFNEKVKQGYAAGEVKSISIDYQFNAIMGYVDNVEVEVYSFNRFGRLDNRYSSYELYAGPTQILIEVK